MTRRPALLRAATVSLGLLCCEAVLAQGLDKARLGPAAYRSHFAPNPGASPDSGSRDGWESYPLVEDAGYDPTIQTETAHGESALLRIAAPTQDGSYRLGFIKRLSMVAGNTASFRVRVRVPDASTPVMVQLSVFHGVQEERHAATVPDSQWHTLQFAISPSATTITAIAIAADLPHAVHDRQERFSIADARLAALATRHLSLRGAATLWDENRALYYLQRSLKPAEDLHLVVGSPADTKTHWTIASPDGLVKAEGEGREIRRHFETSDAPGIWTLHITSATSDTTALLLLRPTRSTGLLFDQAPSIAPALLQSVRARRDLLRATTHAELGRNIARMNPETLLPGLPSYLSLVTQAPELAMLDAIDFRASGDVAARNEARTLLTEIVHWPLWVHPWFPAHGYHSYYPVGMMTKFVVMAEQFLGDDLDASERSEIDHALMELSIKPIYEEYVHEDRLQFNISNWIGNTAGGALLAALASEAPDTAGYALGLYVKERDHVREAYTPDGSYGESTSYQKFDLEMTTLAAAAAKRKLGQSLDQSLMPAERFFRYAAYGDSGLLDYGDSHVALKPSNVFAYLASLNQSDRLTDFYFRYRDEKSSELLSRVLWEGSIHPAAAPASNEPSSALFAQRGVLILRDNWTPGSAVIAMRAGRNFNHNHDDQGSLFFARGGRLWLGEAGYADYYKDPAYPTFNVQAIGHNTLLIDGDAESQVLPGNAVFGASPTTTHALVGDRASLVEADLTSAYAAKLTRYTRTLFCTENGPLIVVDRVAADAPHRYTQVWHPKQTIDAVDAAHAGFRLGDGDHTVSVQAFADAGLSITQRESPLPLTSYERSEHELIARPARFEIETKTLERSARIVTVIQPDGHALSPSAWKQVDGAHVLTLGGIAVALQDGSDSIIASWTEGALALHVTQYREADGILRFSKPVDLRLTRSTDGSALEVDATEATVLTLSGFSLRDQATPEVHLNPGHTTLPLR